MISYQPAIDLSKSAALTYDNMRTYYEHYLVNWDHTKILEQISNLNNWDILFDDKVVGAIRLSFENDECLLRDIQVAEQFRNQGIGTEALLQSIRLAQHSGATKLKLKVFKISPAHRLYKHNGFKLVDEDDRFFSMEKLSQNKWAKIANDDNLLHFY